MTLLTISFSQKLHFLSVSLFMTFAFFKNASAMESEVDNLKKSSSIVLRNDSTFPLEPELPPIKQNIIAAFFAPLDPYNLIDEYQLFNTRRQFIKTYATPPFYRILYQGEPLNIFILPTVHTLPLEALPAYILKVIRTIAKTDGSKLILETVESNEDDGALNPLDDPRSRLNIEECIKRDLKAFCNNYKKIYVIDETDSFQLSLWEDHLNRKEDELRAIYKDGWTKSLTVLGQQTLLKLAEDNDIKFEDLNNFDPYYIYLRTSNSFMQYAYKDNDTRLPIPIQLDTRIQIIFEQNHREEAVLENEDDRLNESVEKVGQK